MMPSAGIKASQESLGKGLQKIILLVYTGCTRRGGRVSHSSGMVFRNFKPPRTADGLRVKAGVFFIY